ncbi:hypothetical protein F5X98DRAFT_341985 [Xylaria grammica]|nr:hypothetical protein F5X98DRAFT_341985 [Xylaria grammica]
MPWLYGFLVAIHPCCMSVWRRCIDMYVRMCVCVYVRVSLSLSRSLSISLPVCVCACACVCVPFRWAAVVCMMALLDADCTVVPLQDLLHVLIASPRRKLSS